MRPWSAAEECFHQSIATKIMPNTAPASAFSVITTARPDRSESGFPRGFEGASLSIDSPEGWAMRGPYPGELRIRVIHFVEAGGSRREAAEQFQVSASSAIRWMQRFHEDGVCEPVPRGGSTSPLEKYSQQILALIREQRDLTLNEIVSVLHRRRIPGSRSALSRFFARHGITFKKKPAGGRAQASRRGSRAPTLDSRARLA